MLRALLALFLLLPSLALAGPNTLAVLYFENTGNPELEPLKVGLADMMISDLQDAEPVKVVERARLQSILDELELGHSGVVDPDSAAKVGKLLGAEWMILGSYFELMGTLHISAKLVRVETSEIVHAEVVRDKPKEFIALEQQLSGKLRDALLSRTAPAPAAPEPAGRRRDEGSTGTAPSPVPASTAPATAEVVAEDADTLAAAISFSEGLIYMDNKDMERARDSFEKAVAQDPGLDDAKAHLAALDL